MSYGKFKITSALIFCSVDREGSERINLPALRCRGRGGEGREGGGERERERAVLEQVLRVEVKQAILLMQFSIGRGTKKLHWQCGSDVFEAVMITNADRRFVSLVLFQGHRGLG